MSTEASKRGRNNKSRAKEYEREVAAILGGRRHLADTGGKEDVEHDTLAIQVKSGVALVNGTIREGLDAARASAVGKNKLPCVVLVHRGRPNRRFIVFGLEEFADWNGFGPSKLKVVRLENGSVSVEISNSVDLSSELGFEVGFSMEQPKEEEVE